MRVNHDIEWGKMNSAFGYAAKFSFWWKNLGSNRNYAMLIGPWRYGVKNRKSWKINAYPLTCWCIVWSPTSLKWNKTDSISFVHHLYRKFWRVLKQLLENFLFTSQVFPGSVTLVSFKTGHWNGEYPMQYPYQVVLAKSVDPRPWKVGLHWFYLCNFEGRRNALMKSII